MAEFTVTTLADETFEGSETPAAPDGNGLSLREALGLANANGAAEPDTIKFDASLAGGVLFLQSGELTITTDGITIDGDIDGDGDADITIDADSAFGVDDAASRVFLIAGAGTIAATLNGLVIRDGAVSGAGGYGGGIAVGTADALTLTNATVSGNSADYGGGIYGSISSSTTLTNATVSGNSAGDDGGGIYGFSNNPITLTNSTVTGNRAGNDGGGIYNLGDNATTTLTNSIVAGNAAGESGDDLFGGLNSSADLVFTGGNVIGSAPVNFASQTGTPTTTINGIDLAALETVFAAGANDPNTGVLSGVLADNGGRVQTIALAARVATRRSTPGPARCRPTSTTSMATVTRPSRCRSTPAAWPATSTSTARRPPPTSAPSSSRTPGASSSPHSPTRRSTEVTLPPKRAMAPASRCARRWRWRTAMRAPTPSRSRPPFRAARCS
jgi:predicted outer membrane repeat protein